MLLSSSQTGWLLQNIYLSNECLPFYADFSFHLPPTTLLADLTMINTSTDLLEIGTIYPVRTPVFTHGLCRVCVAPLFSFPCCIMFYLFFVFVLCLVPIVACSCELSILDCLFEFLFSTVYSYDNPYCGINILNSDISSLCIWN